MPVSRRAFSVVVPNSRTHIPLDTHVASIKLLGMAGCEILLVGSFILVVCVYMRLDFIYDFIFIIVISILTPTLELFVKFG